MSPTQRRALFESVRDRAGAAGLGFEDDPVFLAGVEQWIAGDIDFSTLRGQYLQLLRIREDQKRLLQRFRAVPPPAMVGEPHDDLPEEGTDLL